MTRHRVFNAVHRPKTWYGYINLDTSMYVGGAGFGTVLLSGSVVLGFLVAAVVCVVVRVLTARDPRMIQILWSQRPVWLGGVAGESRYDAARWSR